MKHTLMMILTAVFALGIVGDGFSQKQKKTDTVTFVTNITCGKCAKNIEENLPFEKGVKDVRIDIPEKKVIVVYDTARTTVQDLQKALNKLGYTAEEEKPDAGKTAGKAKSPGHPAPKAAL